MVATQDAAFRVAVLVYPGADILDYAGPIEVLSHLPRSVEPASQPGPRASIQLVGSVAGSAVVTGHDSLAVVPTLDVAGAVHALGAFDVLVVPGGPPDVVQRVLDAGGEELRLIRDFYALPPPQQDGAGAGAGRERVLFSVCTGALLLGAVGVLGGKQCTTHHRALEWLEKVIEAQGGAPRVEAGKRYVDAGVVKPGLRLLTAGGVSSGLDATLRLVELLRDKDAAARIADIIEYDRRQTTA